MYDRVKTKPQRPATRTHTAPHVRKIFLALWIMLGFVAGEARAQSVVVSKYIPGNYLSDNQHVVEITNTTNAAVSISGYFIVTRDYMARVPVGVSIPARGTMRFVKRRGAGDGAAVELSKVPDFLIRIRDRQIEGNYVALLDRNFTIHSGFYYSPLRGVPFLPETDTLITHSREQIILPVPDERTGGWGFLSSADDPAVAFLREGNTWKYTSARPARPAADYRTLSLRYHEGVVAIRFTTAFEEGAAVHLIERSTDQVQFEVIDRVEGAGNSNDLRPYTAYDAGVEPGRTYYYRIRNADLPGRETTSKIAQVKTEEGPVEFSLEVFTVAEGNGTGVNVRFFSRYSQKIKIKVLDERMREVAILFNEYVFAESGHLLKIARALPSGSYTVLADTETQRFSQRVVVR